MTAEVETTLLDFSVDAEKLAAAATRVKPAVAPRSRMPVLAGVKIIASEFGVKVVASNLDLQLSSKVHFNGVGVTHTAGEIIVNHATLAKFLAKAKSKGEVRITANGEDEVTLTAGKIKVRLRTLPIDEYPKVRNPQGETIVLDANAVADVLDAVSNDDTRPILTGLQIQANTYAATDSYRLHVMEVRDLPAVEKDSPELLLQRDAAVLLAKIGGRHNGAIEDGYIKVATPELTIVSRLVEGTFPNWRSLLPASYEPILTFNNETFRAALGEAIDMAKAFGPIGQVHGSGVKIEQTAPDVLTLTLKNYESSVEVTTQGVLTGASPAISFNPLFLQTLFKDSTSGTLIGLDHLKPVLLVEETDLGTRKRLIMPVRIP
jgi:DNA polymerase-3 subunit beta